MSPSISVIIPTLNSERILDQCLASINEQNYKKEKVEIIIADGGSIDRTIEIAKKYKCKILENPLKTGEAGKAVGIKAAKNELVALIDSDNILPDKDWFKKMVEPFTDPEIIGSEPVKYTHREKDSYITRYCALLGMNDPLCYFLGNYDRYSYLSNKWTGFKLNYEDKENYYEIILDKKKMPTIGANGTIIKRDLLTKFPLGDYFFDVDFIYFLAEKGYRKFAKVKCDIVHLFSGNMRLFCFKQKRRIKDFLYYNKLGIRAYPWGSINTLGLMKFIFYCLVFFPLVLQSIKGFIKKRDPVWFLHPVFCEATFLIYTWEKIRSLFIISIMPREKWNELIEGKHYVAQDYKEPPHISWPSITFSIATLNEEKRIRRCLESIKMQDYPKEKIEIIVMDGGSKDKTKEIAREYGCKIYHNPKKLAEPGLTLGYKKAKNDYVVFMAADNVLSEKKCLKKLTKPFILNKEIVLSFCKVINDPKDNIWSKYLNLDTDPFSAFIYGNASHPDKFKKLYPIEFENQDFVVYNYKTKDFPLIALAQCTILKKGVKRSRKLEHDDILPIIEIIKHDKKIAYVKTTGIYHYSLKGYKDFANKFHKRIDISFEFKNYFRREKMMSWKRKAKKYLWIPYSLSLVLPFLYSCYIFLAKKEKAIFLHPIACFTITVLIFYNLALRLCRKLKLAQANY